MKKVRAIERGFYLCLREAGEVFTIPADLNGSWFVAVEDDKQPDHKPDKPKGKKEDDKQPA